MYLNSLKKKKGFAGYLRVKGWEYNSSVREKKRRGIQNDESKKNERNFYPIFIEIVPSLVKQHILHFNIYYYSILVPSDLFIRVEALCP